MSWTVWKFEVEVTDEFRIGMPRDAELLHVRAEGPARIWLWARANPKHLPGTRRIMVRGTGHGNVDPEWPYVGTVVPFEGLVWHVFDGGWV